MYLRLRLNLVNSAAPPVKPKKEVDLSELHLKIASLENRMTLALQSDKAITDLSQKLSTLTSDFEDLKASLAAQGQSLALI